MLKKKKTASKVFSWQFDSHETYWQSGSRRRNGCPECFAAYRSLKLLRLYSSLGPIMASKYVSMPLMHKDEQLEILKGELKKK